MYRIYYAEKDTTLYENHVTRNTGVDEILELTKVASGSILNGHIMANTYNSRILIDFGTEITSLSQSISEATIPAINVGSIASASVFLNLHAADAEDVIDTYTVEAYAVSESWDNGLGVYGNQPSTKVGASWENRKGDPAGLNAVAWNTASADGHYSGATVSTGGGTWMTSDVSSETFINRAPDIRIDVTNIVSKLVNNTLPNYGFILKRPNVEEINGDVYGSLKFFSRDSHTIYVPRLEVCWDDSIIGSSDNVITSNTYVPYIKNIKNEYRTSERARFFIGVRPEFPTKSYTTGSWYQTTDLLPISSSYEIIDSVTNDIIIKDEKIFGNSTTKISTNLSDGSFFDLRMDSFMPERYYKIKLTCRRTNDTQTFDDFYFKVVN